MQIYIGIMLGINIMIDIITWLTKYTICSWDPPRFSCYTAKFPPKLYECDD